MGYQGIQDLIQEFSQFEEETGSSDIKKFSSWLHERHVMPPEEELVNSPHYTLDTEFMVQLTFLNQHAKHYIKTALKDTPLSSLYDFSFLFILYYKESLRKSELIAENMMEFSPGMEVIRRLLRKELIEDFADPNDGRSRRVKITSKGRAIMEIARHRIAQVSRIITGNLRKSEKAKTLNILHKLSQFHRPIWEQNYGTDLDSITRYYLDAPSET